MKILLTALAGFALVACSSEPNEAADKAPANTEIETPAGSDASTDSDAPADNGAAKAQVVSLKVAGMT